MTSIANSAKSRLPLETRRLRIEEFQLRHITAEYVGWLNDPIVVRYSEQRFESHTAESCYTYLKSFEGSPNLFLAVSDQEAHRQIGTMTAYVEDRHQVADVGILIGDPEAWGRGYATEAFLAVCTLLFDSGARKVTAGTVASNYGMLAVMEKAGMQDDGRRIEHRVLDGQPVDVVHRALFSAPTV